MKQAPSWRIGALVPAADLPELAREGYDFAELPCDELRADVNDQRFARLRKRLASIGLPVDVCSRFLPRDFKLVGPDVGWSRFTESVDTELARAAQLGAELVVWANGPARTVPVGFPMERAFEQMVTAGRYVAKAARTHGLTVVFEALNPSSSNLILSLGEALRLVNAIGEPEVMAVADVYHMARNGEPLASITQLGQALRYVHVCDHDRRPPGTHPADAPHYAELGGVLGAMGYTGRISIEATWDDVAAEAGPALAALRRQLARQPAENDG